MSNVICKTTQQIEVPQNGGTYKIDVKGICQKGLFWTASSDGIENITFDKVENPTQFIIGANPGSAIYGSVTISVYATETDRCLGFPTESCLTPIYIKGNASIIITLDKANFQTTGGTGTFNFQTESDGILTYEISTSCDWVTTGTNATIDISDNETTEVRNCTVTVTARTSETEAYPEVIRISTFEITQACRQMPADIVITQTPLRFSYDGGTIRVNAIGSGDGEWSVTSKLILPGGVTIDAIENSHTREQWLGYITIPAREEGEADELTGTVETTAIKSRTATYFETETTQTDDFWQAGRPQVGEFNFSVIVEPSTNVPATGDSLNYQILITEASASTPTGTISGSFYIPDGGSMTFRNSSPTPTQATLNDVHTGDTVGLIIPLNDSFNSKRHALTYAFTDGSETKTGTLYLYQDGKADVQATIVIEASGSTTGITTDSAFSSTQLSVTVTPNNAPWKLKNNGTFVFFDRNGSEVTEITGTGNTTGEYLRIRRNDTLSPRTEVITGETTYNIEHYINATTTFTVSQARGEQNDYTINLYARTCLQEEEGSTQTSTALPKVNLTWDPLNNIGESFTYEIEAPKEPTYGFEKKPCTKAMWSTLNDGNSSALKLNDYEASHPEIYMLIQRYCGGTIDNYSYKLSDYINKDENELYTTEYLWLKEGHDDYKQNTRSTLITFSDYEIDLFGYSYILNIRIDSNSNQFLLSASCENTTVMDATPTNIVISMSASTEEKVWHNVNLSDPEHEISIPYNVGQILVERGTIVAIYEGNTEYDLSDIANAIQESDPDDLKYIKVQIIDSNNKEEVRYLVNNNGYWNQQDTIDW